MVAIGGSGRSEHELKLVPVRSLLAAEPRVKRAPRARSSPGSVRLALTFSLFGRNPGRANARCGNPGCCARLRAKEYTRLRAASSCSRRSSIRAAGARQGRPRERADPTTDTGCRIEKVGLLPFSVGRPVSGVQSGVVRQFFANRKMLINQSGLAHVTVK